MDEFHYLCYRCHYEESYDIDYGDKIECPFCTFDTFHKIILSSEDYYRLSD